MIWILIVAGVISSALGEAIDAVAILAIGRPQRRDRLLSGIRREKSIATLKQLTAPEAAVRREGKVLLIPAAEIVTGDILVRAAVELIAADIRLLAASALECTEAVLTGESKVVKKSPAMLAAAEVPVGDCTNRVFMGTGVATSSGEGVVVATAMQTALGRIAGSRQRCERLLRQTNQFAGASFPNFPGPVRLGEERAPNRHKIEISQEPDRSHGDTDSTRQFFAQPAKFKSESANSVSQNRRCEQWKISTLASVSGTNHCSISCGMVASLAVKP